MVTRVLGGSHRTRTGTPLPLILSFEVSHSRALIIEEEDSLPVSHLLFFAAILVANKILGQSSASIKTLKRRLPNDAPSRDNEYSGTKIKPFKT